MVYRNLTYEQRRKRDAMRAVSAQIGAAGFVATSYLAKKEARDSSTPLGHCPQAKFLVTLVLRFVGG